MENNSVSETYLKTFGKLSPMNSVKSDSFVIDAISEVISKSTCTSNERAFSIFMKMTETIPEINKETNSIVVNEYIKSAIRTLTAPFFAYSIEKSIESVNQLSEDKYIVNELQCSNSIARVIGVKNITTMIVDTVNEVNSNSHGPIVYIDRAFKNTANIPDGVETNWVDGFFKFKNADSLIITILIPKQYIKNVMLNAQMNGSKELSEGSLGNLVFKDICNDSFISDFIKAFFVAIVNDSERNKMLSDFAYIYNILLNEGLLICSKFCPKDAEWNNPDYVTYFDEFKAKYAEDFSKRFNMERNSIIKNTFTYFVDCYQENSNRTINPYDFYDIFVNVPYNQILTIMNKFPSISDTKSSEYDLFNNNVKFENSLCSLDIFINTNNDRALISLGLKIVRYIPFMLYAFYILAQGNNHGEAIKFFSNITGYLNDIKSLKLKNKLYTNICSYIEDSINEYMEMFEKISSPQYVGSSSRRFIRKLFEVTEKSTPVIME
jgi:hypothetical protein